MPGRRRHGRQRRDARHDLERDPGGRERERFLAAAAEHERVAALEAHGLEAPSAEVDEQLVQLRLLQLGARDQERVVGRLGDELWRNEHVVDERLARADELEASRRDQPRVARARADQEHRHERRPS